MIAPTMLPLRGAVNLVDRGVATSQNYVYRMPPLRFSGTSPQGEAFSAPIEGSCRQRRLRGGIKFSHISKGMSIASLNTEMF